MKLERIWSFLSAFMMQLQVWLLQLSLKMCISQMFLFREQVAISHSLQRRLQEISEVVFFSLILHRKNNNLINMNHLTGSAPTLKQEAHFDCEYILSSASEQFQRCT